MKARRILSFTCFFLAGMLTSTAVLYQMGWINRSVGNPQSVEELSTLMPFAPAEETTGSNEDIPHRLSETNGDVLTSGSFDISPERIAYQDGDLQLVIPKLNIDTPVLNGTDAATLSRGACLYEYAQLPGEGDRNVSIASHRNGVRNGIITEGGPASFYYVDTLTDGDFLYLHEGENIYQYLWKDATVVNPDNWWPIYYQGFSCLTLTTCTPIGPGTHRLIIRAELWGIHPYSEQFNYTTSLETMT